MLGSFDNTLTPDQVVKFRKEFANIIDEIRAKQYNKTSGLDMLGEPRGHRSRVAQSSTPADKSSLSLPEAMEKDALDVQFATRIDREEVLPKVKYKATFLLSYKK